MFSGGFRRGLGVLELWRVGLELVQHASFAMAHVRLRWLLDVLEVVGYLASSDVY